MWAAVLRMTVVRNCSIRLVSMCSTICVLQCALKRRKHSESFVCVCMCTDVFQTTQLCLPAVYFSVFCSSLSSLWSGVARCSANAVFHLWTSSSYFVCWACHSFHVCLSRECCAKSEQLGTKCTSCMFVEWKKGWTNSNDRTSAGTLNNVSFLFPLGISIWQTRGNSSC